MLRTQEKYALLRDGKPAFHRGARVCGSTSCSVGSVPHQVPACGAQVLSRLQIEPPSHQATAVPGQRHELCLAYGGGSQLRPSAVLQLLAGSSALRLGLLNLLGVVSDNMSRVIKILRLRRGSCQPHKSHLLYFTNETRAAGTVLITSSISFMLAWNFICMPTATGFHQQLTLSDRELNQTKADLLLTTS